MEAIVENTRVCEMHRIVRLRRISPFVKLIPTAAVDISPLTDAHREGLLNVDKHVPTGA
jgi:hypothetical protein